MAETGPIHPAIMGLIQLLPNQGEAMSSELRSNWLISIEAALKLIYPALRDQEAPDDRALLGEVPDGKTE